MKNLLIAVVISFVLVVVYTIVLLIVAPLTGNDIMKPPQIMSAPLSLPWIAYDLLAPDSVQAFFFSNPSTSLIHRFLMFLSNVAIYTIPVSVILWIRSKIVSK